MTKKEFVDTYLKPLLQNANMYVDEASYKRTLRREIVTVTYTNGTKQNIDVTGRCLASLVVDVIQKCK